MSTCREELRVLQESHVGKEQLTVEQGEPGCHRGEINNACKRNTLSENNSEKATRKLSCSFKTLVSHKGWQIFSVLSKSILG